jgi:hypothetical protein
VIEALEDGWWYSAGLQDGSLVEEQIQKIVALAATLTPDSPVLVTAMNVMG